MGETADFELNSNKHRANETRSHSSAVTAHTFAPNELTAVALGRMMSRELHSWTRVKATNYSQITEATVILYVIVIVHTSQTREVETSSFKVNCLCHREIQERFESTVISQPLHWHMNMSTNIEHTCYRLLKFPDSNVARLCRRWVAWWEESPPPPKGGGEWGIVRAAACTCAEGESAVMV